MEFVRELEREAEKENVFLGILNVFWGYLEWTELDTLRGPEPPETGGRKHRKGKRR